ncbi:DUF4344 domain-containing metallopeptidase [Streptomyces sp. AP-93]|uniref:DUF4344 domain-containing metallopeptidase n=1 Tax=Streptomyces sp. AP-93 TaxID=2929048 RepID=UPI001FAFF841|nr:DUF4344 domain-containing metallopeptidase [Streptomyces sp. AP-93]MCJ0874689.1 DUF4344 domain-containing metallopeptidase [Streptomyces sp. AP-93]
MTALLLAATAGCELLPKEPVPTRGFWLRYEKPVAADRDEARFLKQWILADMIVGGLNDYVDLPHLVTVVVRSCHGEGSGYAPQARRIDFCYDDLGKRRELFSRAESPLHDEDLADLVNEMLYHEVGHALIDALHLPAGGDRAEGDAADRFAQLMLNGSKVGAEALLIAARAYDLSAAFDPTSDLTTAEHAPPAARAESHRCAVYGASPTRHKALATPSRTDCAATWTHTRDTWTHDLAPLLRHS